ncbi:MAG: hypothetical protein Q8K78_17555 [Planctomycetaceae bacterium]|nr:hypothetical protein [Planctomycetaceae bacterium]
MDEALSILNFRSVGKGIAKKVSGIRFPGDNVGSVRIMKVVNCNRATQFTTGGRVGYGVAVAKIGGKWLKRGKIEKNNGTFVEPGFADSFLKWTSSTSDELIADAEIFRL